MNVIVHAEGDKVDYTFERYVEAELRKLETVNKTEEACSISRS